MHMSMWAVAKHILLTDAAQRMQLGDRFEAAFSQVFQCSLGRASLGSPQIVAGASL